MESRKKICYRHSHKVGRHERVEDLSLHFISKTREILFDLSFVLLANRLCLEVERLGLSAVIMGSRGFGATKRDNSGRLGSFSDYCVRHCVCPVVVVRYPEEKDGGGGAEPVVSVASAVEDEEEEPE